MREEGKNCSGSFEKAFHTDAGAVATVVKSVKLHGGFACPNHPLAI